MSDGHTFKPPKPPISHTDMILDAQEKYIHPRKTARAYRVSAKQADAFQTGDELSDFTTEVTKRILSIFVHYGFTGHEAVEHGWRPSGTTWKLLARTIPLPFFHIPEGYIPEAIIDYFMRPEWYAGGFLKVLKEADASKAVIGRFGDQLYRPFDGWGTNLPADMISARNPAKLKPKAPQKQMEYAFMGERIKAGLSRYDAAVNLIEHLMNINKIGTKDKSFKPYHIKPADDYVREYSRSANSKLENDLTLEKTIEESYTQSMIVRVAINITKWG